MSEPAAKAFSPAPRTTMQRNASSADSSRMASPRRAHIALFSAFSRSGLLSATVAMPPSRETRMGSADVAMACGALAGLLLDRDAAGLDQLRVLDDLAREELRELLGADRLRLRADFLELGFLLGQPHDLVDLPI